VQIVSNVDPGTLVARVAIKGITTPSGTAGLTWRLDSPNNTVINMYLTDGSFNLQDITTGTDRIFTNPADQPLPVELSSFTVAPGNNRQVVLSWTTVSEKNNYGFEVQRSLDSVKNYQTIPNSFVKGNGTTLASHTYSYTVANPGLGKWYYRLKQVDLDGMTTYTSGVQGTVKPPAEFSLDQNYPNPFNPTTTISYALPKDARVTLEVYNVIGQRVALLVDEAQVAGYYRVPFDVRAFASGIYFYRLATPEVQFLKKMLVVK
jgi:hypothetical protein